MTPEQAVAEARRAELRPIYLLLGEERFADWFVLRPAELGGEPWQGNRSVCKKWLADQRRYGKTVITPAQEQRIRGMARSIARHELVRQGILNGEIERTMAWRDPDTGVWVLIRPDVIPTDSGDFVDMKTARAVDYASVAHAIDEGGYHMQGAMVGDVWKALTGEEMQSFSLFFIESDRPHCCGLYRLTTDDLALGQRLYRHAMKRFVRAVNTNSWPGPGGDSLESYASLSGRARAAAEALLARAEAGGSS